MKQDTSSTPKTFKHIKADSKMYKKGKNQQQHTEHLLVSVNLVYDII